MRIFVLLSVLIFGCSTTQPVSCPPPTTIVQRDTVERVEYVDVPIYDTALLIDTQYLPNYITRLDTFYLPMANTELVTAFSDSLFVGTWFQPSGGDDYPAIQAAINYAQIHPGYPIHFAPGNYSLSHPLIVARMVGADYGQSWIDLEGMANAKNAPASATANFIPTFTDKPVIILQQCKGCVIKNISIHGRYILPSQLRQIQIDTNSYAQWSDGVCSDGATNPYTGIAVDPFSDSVVMNSVNAPLYKGLESYYLPGMSRNGSTDVRIENCAISNFVAGIVITPSNQQNGEEIDVDNNHIDYCRSAIAWCQAQSKENRVANLMCWGGVNTVFDGINYGVRHGDGSTAPMIDGVNVAGFVNQLFNVSVNSFPLHASNIYAEGLYKIGSTTGYAGVLFEGFQIDFQNAASGSPSPSYYYYGLGTTWIGCQLRLYNNGTPNRILLNDPGNAFIGGMMSAPPYCAIVQPMNGPWGPPTFTNVGMFYSGVNLNTNTYDSTATYYNDVQVHVQNGFNGWYLSSTAIPTESKGDLIVSNLVPFAHDPYGNYLAVFPVGFVISVDKDTVFLSNTGENIHDGDMLTLIDAKIKTY